MPDVVGIKRMARRDNGGKGGGRSEQTRQLMNMCMTNGRLMLEGREIGLPTIT